MFQSLTRSLKRQRRSRRAAGDKRRGRRLLLEQLEARLLLHSCPGNSDDICDEVGYADYVEGNYITEHTISFDIREALTGNRFTPDDPVASDVTVRISEIFIGGSVFTKSSKEPVDPTKLPDVSFGPNESMQLPNEIQLEIPCQIVKFQRSYVIDHIIEHHNETDPDMHYHTEDHVTYDEDDGVDNIPGNYPDDYFRPQYREGCPITYDIEYLSDDPNWDLPNNEYNSFFPIKKVSRNSPPVPYIPITIPDREVKHSLQRKVFLSGQVFVDRDADGVRDLEGEETLPGIRIGGAGDVMTTDENGYFAAETTRPRHMTLRPILTTDGGVPTHRVTTGTRSDPADVTTIEHDVGVFKHATARGTVFHDANANGYQDGGETDLENVTVFWDSDHDNHRDGGLSRCFPQLLKREYCEVTDDEGNFDLLGGFFGDDLAIEAKLDNDTLYRTTFDPIRVKSSGQIFDNLRIGVATGINLAGRVYDDEAGNGVYDHGPDARRVGVDVMLDLGNDGTVDYTVQTDSEGIYVFPQVVKGSHRIYTELDRGETLTQPNDQQGYLLSPDDEPVQSDLDFGVKLAIVVNSTGDASDADTSDGRCDTGIVVDGNPECTLRAAIEQANADSTLNSIYFNIPGDGPHRITITNKLLPTITQPVDILGYSQPGSQRGERDEETNERTDPIIAVEIDGTGIIGTGLELQGGDSLVEGLAIYGFGGAAIELRTGDRNNVLGNFIGLHGNSECVSCIGSALGFVLLNLLTMKSVVVGQVDQTTSHIIKVPASSFSPVPPTQSLKTLSTTIKTLGLILARME